MKLQEIRQEQDELAWAHRLAELVKSRTPFTIFLHGSPFHVENPSDLMVPDDLYERVRSDGTWEVNGKLFAFKAPYGHFGLSGTIRSDGRTVVGANIEFASEAISAIYIEGKKLYREAP